ncbi:ComEA family DNA-binding protein [Pseudomonas sp. NPDC088322]|uniref:ComEA family DNA-binding protein n=1 Tax=Pseudomonas sp. NPDC088322 TaxID=3364452 RepID=UPI00380AE837
MRNTILSYLLLPLFAGLSFSVSAAPGAPGEPIPIVAQAATAHPKTNLNTADASTLQRELNGIGQAKAQAIVAYREANGPFQSVDELLEIKGIGNALMERNRDRLTLE